MLRTRLGENQPRNLRQPVPKRDGQRGTPRTRRALHRRRQHPQSHRRPVYGQPAPTLSGSLQSIGQSQTHRRHPRAAPRNRPPAIPRPRLWLRQLPRRRLPRTAAAGRRHHRRTVCRRPAARHLHHAANPHRPVPRHRNRRIPRPNRQSRHVAHRPSMQPAHRRTLRPNPPLHPAHRQRGNHQRQQPAH